MARVILAVGVCIAGLSTLMTNTDDVLGNPFPEAFIENKILSEKLVGNAQCVDLPFVFDNATVKLVHLVEAKVLEPCAGLLASNPTGAVHHQILVFLAFEHFTDNRK
jgi:hypothetical protein